MFDRFIGVYVLERDNVILYRYVLLPYLPLTYCR